MPSGGRLGSKLRAIENVERSESVKGDGLSPCWFWSFHRIFWKISSALSFIKHWWLLTEPSLLASDDAPQLLNRILTALLVGVCIKLLLCLFLLFISLFPVQLCKWVSSGASPSAVSIPERHRMDRGRCQWCLSAVWQEDPTPWAAFAVWVCT